MIYMFHKEIAEEFGLAEATLFYHIAYWVRRNRKEKRNYHDGKYWVYNSAQELADGPHKYLSVYQIRRALNHLVDEGMLQLGRYNKKGYDRTYWYTLTKKAEDLLHLCEMDASYLQDASNK